jgi:hypothetical protein
MNKRPKNLGGHAHNAHFRVAILRVHFNESLTIYRYYTQKHIYLNITVPSTASIQKKCIDFCNL